MNKLFKIVGGSLVAVIALVIGVAFYANANRLMIIARFLPQAEEIVSERLGVPVRIGSVDLGDRDLFDIVFNLDKVADIVIHDVAIFDKKSELIARVDKAKINLKPIALRDDPAAAIDEIKIDGALVNVIQRDEKTWNFDDIEVPKSEGESTFGAKIFLEHGTVNAHVDGKDISVEEISASADCANMKAIDAKLSAKTLGAHVTATGIVGSEKQIVSAEVDAVDAQKVLPYLPADKIPEGVQILRGLAQNLKVHVMHDDKDTLKYLASVDVKDAAVKVERTDIENINGTVTLNEREIFFDASAEAQGQHAQANGKIRLDTDETFLDVYAESPSFTPTAVMSDIGINGSAAIRAHLVGTATNPQIDGEIFSDWLGYENFSASNISTKFRYVGEMLYINDAAATVFGGQVAGTAEIKTADKTFSANVKVNGLDAAALCDFAGSEQTVDGKISADLGVDGSNLEQMKVFGTANAVALNFRGLEVTEANASFFLRDKDLTIDYLSANLPNKGTLGLEGTVTNLSQLDLKFYGAHVDMNIAERFNNQLSVSGLADFKGSVKGDASNPAVALELSAVDNSAREGSHFVGELFKQPFDSIQLAASGNLSGVHIDKFNLEKGGKLKWTVVEGSSVGLTGEKVINVEVNTNLARAEDIAALVAPDQPITGNVTNTVKVTGTLDAPKVSGQLKFNRGSYHGVLLSGMEGEYFLDGDILRLQNFTITSPMIDAIFNGTFNTKTQQMDFVVQGNDINLRRFQAKLPETYVATGHAKFEGLIKGTPAVPICEGELKSDEIFLNGVSIDDIYGHVLLNGRNLFLEEFRFTEGDGQYKVQWNANLDTQAMSGEVIVTSGDIPNLFRIADKKTNLITGKIDSTILIGGTFQKPSGSMIGEIVSGTFAGYEISNINIDASLANNVVRINKLEGYQGDKGKISMNGTADLNGGEAKILLTAKDIALGMFAKAAGYKKDDVSGTTEIVAQLSGTINDPFGELIVISRGGSFGGSNFDEVYGHFLFRDRRVNVEELRIERELGGRIVSANAEGYIPLKALTADKKEKLPDDEQLDLSFSLDGADLSLLPVLSNYVAWGIGNLEGSIKVTGTAAHPQVNGQVSLIDGSVKVKGMKTLIEHFNVAANFKGERFDLEKFSGKMGGGEFTLTGGFSFPGLEFTNYNFDFAAKDLDIESTFYGGKFNANFNFSEGEFFHWHLPKLTGQIDLDRCRVGIPTIPDDDSPTPNIILDVTLNLGEKAHFYSSRLFDMYLVGSARFEGTSLHPKSSGSIHVKRGGTLTYLESVFNIREGEAHFNQIDTFLPSLHFYADTKIGTTKVFLYIDGSPDNMKFKLGSSPEMTETEIFRLLTLREAYRDGGGSFTAADAVAIGLQMTVLADLEDMLKKSLGIDQFRVARGSGSIFEKYSTHSKERGEREKSYNITIGKYINDKIMVHYTHGFGGAKKVHRFGIQYDFNDNLGFMIEREGSHYIFGIEARYKF
ncbi:MAG: translocation/assembly module TamB domain-containing protein [Selenomonadaceae bacterium]|nr:translocation/assembly module TamB domain-containing protein [Selenomonadaceae bacterium]